MATNSEQITDSQELAALRASHTEVLAKSHERKTRIEALEAENATLKARIAEAEESKHNITVKQPLAKRAAAISPAPGLFIDFLERNYAVNPDKDGKLVLCNKEDGKPIEDAGATIDILEGNSLWHYLTGGAKGASNEQQKAFASIMRYQGASGGGGGTGGTTKVSALPSKKDKSQPAKTTVHFGLK